MDYLIGTPQSHDQVHCKCTEHCHTRETAGKLAGNILNVLMMYQMGICQVHCPCPYNVLTVYQVGTLGFVPSESSLLESDSEEEH